MSRRAFVAVSGGGAKGVVHVGALKALELRGVRLFGLAGTSAGAIVAALAAAGFKADELIDPISGQTIMQQLAQIDPSLQRATDLFGPGGWGRLRLFRFALRQPLLRPALVGSVWLLPSVVALAISWFAPRYALLFGTISWLATAAIIWRLCRWLTGGLADLHRFRDALSKLLQSRMFPGEPGRIVRMKDFGCEGRPQLKVVSANLSRRALHLFSADRTPETPAADAVAASICLPVIFRPWEIAGELHMDGGMPAWRFDEERELDPEALTIAVEIEDQSTEGRLGPYNWLAAAVRTALFGSGELNLRVAGPAERLALPTSFDLLDFDRSASDAAKEAREVAIAAGVRLDKGLFRLPEIYQDACRVAQALAVDGLGLSPNGRGSAPRIRVAVGRLERGYLHSLRFSHGVGFEDDPDEAMLVPLDGSVAGQAWRDRASRLEIYPLAGSWDLPGDQNRLRRKMRWPDVKWIMCSPILNSATGEARLLVQMQGNTSLRSDADTLAVLEAVEESIQDFF